MTYAERLSQWNRWYDDAPKEWRFQVIFWFMIAAGAVNMTLTIANGFPFGLLVLLAAMWLTSVRMPYVLGWVTHPEGAAVSAKMQIEPAEWVYKVNLWYDEIHEFNKPFYMLGALIIVGWINMALTIHYAFTFGLLFLIGLLAVIIIRGPYVSGWYTVPAGLQPKLALPPQAHPAQLPAHHVTMPKPAPVPASEPPHQV